MRSQKLGWISIVAMGCVFSSVPGCGVRVELDSGDAGLASTTGGASNTVDPNTGGQSATGGFSATGGSSVVTYPATGGIPATSDAATATSDAGTPTSDAGTAPTAEIQASLMARWNQVVESHPSNFDFHWVAFDEYMPPTFRGGTQEAYQAYAKLLLAFMQQSDNFDYLASNHLFDIRLDYVSITGLSIWDSTFSKEVATLASDTAYGNIDAVTRAGLKQIADRIALVK